MIEPWEVVLDPSKVPIEKPVTVRIPNPVSFMVQKLLVLDERSRPDRAKDLLYIHDTLLMFGDARGELARLWVETVSTSLHPTTRASLKRRFERHLTPEATALFEAARIASESRRPAPPSPTKVRAVCLAGLAFAFSGEF